MDFSHSPRAQQLLKRVQAFMAEEILPAEREITGNIPQHGNWQQWQVPAAIERLKTRARAEGLWNLFLPDPDQGAGLDNRDYAPLAEAMGHSLLAPEIFNCNAPDTGNMELLHRYGTEDQQQRWLAPLLAGESRSAFCMTEPAVASSDATNMQATARVEGDVVVLDGRKWWSSGIGHPNCRFVIFMGLTDPEGPRHARHSMVIVPLDTPGVEIKRMLSVYGYFDAPYGHGEVHFNQVRVPRDHLIGGPGRGFEIAQGRLGPGRIHHCMRCIGAAERALALMIERGNARVAFGKPLTQLGANRDIIADARIAIEQARLLTLKAAYLMDTAGISGAMSEISQIKVVAPNMALKVIDQAIQMHGGAGLCEDYPLASLYACARILRLADGPDEVHRTLIARQELKPYRKTGSEPARSTGTGK